MPNSLPAISGSVPACHRRTGLSEAVDHVEHARARVPSHEHASEAASNHGEAHTGARHTSSESRSHPRPRRRSASIADCRDEPTRPRAHIVAVLASPFWRSAQHRARPSLDRRAFASCGQSEHSWPGMSTSPKAPRPSQRSGTRAMHLDGARRARAAPARAGALPSRHLTSCLGRGQCITCARRAGEDARRQTLEALGMNHFPTARF